MDFGTRFKRVERRSACGDFGKSGMSAHTTEPVGGIAKVRLPPVHNTMDEGAVGPFDLLSQRVRGVEVIVPKEKERADKLLVGGCEPLCRQNLIETVVHFGDTPGSRARTWTEVRKSGCCE